MMYFVIRWRAPCTVATAEELLSLNIFNNNKKLIIIDKRFSFTMNEYQRMNTTSETILYNRGVATGGVGNIFINLSHLKSFIHC